jgi:phenylalanine-4-hydroxylase
MTPLALPADAAADWTIDQCWSHYTPAEHALWDRLYARQTAQLRDRAHPAFLRGLDSLDLGGGGIPDFRRLSERLDALTGWQVVAVPGLVPDDVFFRHLSERRFVAGNFIRTPEQLDYLEAPDVFHDVFGHVPLLADPVFADYMQAYGAGGLRSLDFGALKRLSRLYWYTVEFGLIRDGGDLKLYGAGIVSSHGESVFALDDPSPHRIGFDLARVMRTPYKIDDYQALYVVIDSFEQLLRTTIDTDFGPLYRRLADEPDIAIADLQPGDAVLTAGTQRRTQ